MKKRYVLMLIVIMFFVYVEIKPCEIFASSVFTSADSTDIRLYVLVNSLLPLDEEKLAKEIVDKNRLLNGPRENPTYELILYRTKFHYKQNLELNTLLCDENGNII